MARIRSIKPEFWTAGQILECSVPARLLFIGLWNFCDDRGVHPFRPKQIKAQIFPADALTDQEVSGMLDELSTNGLIHRFSSEEGEYLAVCGWHHQRIDKPQKSKYPPPPPECSKNDIGMLPPEGKGKEGKGRERIGEEKHLGDHGSPPSCPFEEIVSLYHESLPALTKCKVLTDARKAHIRARWREYPDIEDWREFFRRVASSKFLTGRTNGRDGRKPFVADLAWLVKAENFAKVLEGKYAG